MPTAFQADVDAYFATLEGPATRAGVSFLEGLRSRGWLVPAWGAPWGGDTTLTPAEVLYLDRARVRSGLVDPNPLVADFLGPLLMERASQEQLERWLPATAVGKLRWSVHRSLLALDPLPFEGSERGPVTLAAPLTLSAEHRAETGSPAPDLIIALGHREASRAAGGQGREESALLVAPLAVVSSDDLPAAPSGSFEVVGELENAAALSDRIHALHRRAERQPRSPAAAIERLLEKAAPVLEPEALAAQEVALRALRALEERAFGATVDADLAGAVRIRGAELGTAVAHQTLDSLGYYALAAVPPRRHNEFPDAAFLAQDAVARLIRYVGGLESVRTRDAIASRRFGLGAVPEPVDPRTGTEERGSEGA